MPTITKTSCKWMGGLWNGKLKAWKTCEMGRTSPLPTITPSKQEYLVNEWRAPWLTVMWLVALGCRCHEDAEFSSIF